jgi:TatD DNase family protein
MLFDSHAHLTAPDYANDLDQVLTNARDASVGGIIAIGSGYGPPNNAATVNLARKHENMWATVGVHPHEASEDSKKVQREIIELAGYEVVVAIGEIGLDFHYDNSPRPVQRSVFEQYLQIAADLKLPAVVHSREAHGESLAMLRAAKLPRAGVMHCFSGDLSLAEKLIDIGFYISIPGVVTFPKAQEMQEVAANIDLDRLLIETDCPYLSPVPRRGKRNEPAYVKHTAAKVAELRGMSEEELARKTTANVERLFNLKIS